jgi:hypothetical protein
MYVSTSGEVFLLVVDAVNCEENRTAKVINTIVVLYVLQLA